MKSYDPKQEWKHVIYLDANNLYGYAMSTFLLTNDFKWSKQIDLNKYTSNSSKGCILKVDLEYPKELWQLHYDYTLAPNKIEIKREMLPNVFDKEKYVTHYENMQLYLRSGFKGKKYIVY